jgi:ribosomal protein S18 acetylase RimI-like enzyme
VTQIRLARPEDIPVLADIEARCFSEGYADKMLSADDFAELVSSDTDKVLVCDLEGRVAGYALLLVETHEQTEGYFDSLAVDPQMQGKGLGEILFKAVEQLCMDLHIPRLNLEIKENNYTLLKRYHRFGYKCFRIEEEYYADGWGAIRMYKNFE